MYKRLEEIAYSSVMPNEAKYRNCIHDYQTVNYDTPANIHIIRCSKCGIESLSWDWENWENDK